MARIDKYRTIVVKGLKLPFLMLAMCYVCLNLMNVCVFIALGRSIL